MRRILRDYWFPIAFLLLISLRFFHFGNLIESPHAWRQCDTAQYIYSFYQDGVDLLYPSVCWMGNHKTTILEFPLPEALTAILYRLFGPSHFWARLVTLLFFLGSSYYFFRILSSFSSQRTAKVATLIFLAMPLGIYFSRAIHIDFAAVFFAHGMLWYLMKWVKNEKTSDLGWGILFACLAFLVKAPYAFYFILLIGWLVIRDQKWRLIPRAMPGLALIVLVFLIWENHVSKVNSLAPDWSFIPDYHRFDKMTYWYLGSWKQRMLGENWMLIWNRIRTEILGGFALVFAGFGLLFSGKKERISLWLWLLGAAFSVLIFFNLNKVHNYYQIPLMAPLAFAMALGLDRVFHLLDSSRFKIGSILVGATVLIFAFQSFQYAEENYYKVGFVPIGAGHFIQKNTPEDALIIASYGGLDARAPHVLYRSRRYGWSIMDMFLKPQLIEELRRLGARHLAIIRREKHQGEMHIYLEQFPVQEFDLKDGGWKLFLYDLAGGDFGRVR